MGVTCSETTLGGWSWFGIGGCADSLLDFGAGAGSEVGCDTGSGPEFDSGAGAGTGPGPGFCVDVVSGSGSDSGADSFSGSDFGADGFSGSDFGVGSGPEFATGDFGDVGGFVAKGLGLCPPAPPVGGATTETGGCSGPDVIIIGVPPPNTCVSGTKGPEKELFLP